MYRYIYGHWAHVHVYLHLIEDKHEHYMNMGGSNFDRSDTSNPISL